MFDIMNRLSAEFGGFESLAYYLKFLSFIAPKVLDLLFGVTPKGKAMQERKKFLYSNFPVPSKVGFDHLRSFPIQFTYSCLIWNLRRTTSIFRSSQHFHWI